MVNPSVILASGVPGGAQIWHQSELTDAERKRLHGQGFCRIGATIEAGSTIAVEFVFEIGEQAIPCGGKLRVAWRWPFDWAEPEAMVVETSSAEIGVFFEPRGDLNPWQHHIELEVLNGKLEHGDRVVLRCEEWGGPTFATQDAFFLLLINPDGGSDWIRLVDPVSYAVCAAPAVRIVAIAQAEGVVGQELGLRVVGEDRWGNPTSFDGSLQFGGTEAEVKEVGEESDWPVRLCRARWRVPGIYRLRVFCGDLVVESNPVRIHAEEPEHRLFWGDLHAGQTAIGCGAGSLERHFAYARYAAGLHFASQQANDHYITRELWDHVRTVSHACDEPGEFVAYLGCEWSPPTEDGGDRNVIYRADEARLKRSGRFFVERDPDPEPDLERAPEFLAAFRDEEVLLNLHVGGRPTNLAWHEPEIEPLFEIHSTHGTSEWFVEEAIRRGYKVGITGGTDGVMGRPGACRPGRRVTRNVRNGLTAVCARELTREGLWEAFSARRCYATSGERILLWVEVDGHPLGAEYATNGHPLVRVEVEGTAAIERVDLLRGLEVIQQWSIAAPDPGRLRVLFGGAERQGTAGEQRVIWDGELSVDGGKCSALRPIGLQCAEDEVWQPNAKCVAWKGATGGNDMGFSAEIDGGRCSFVTDPCSFEFDPVQTANEPLRVAVGGADKRVAIGPAPAEDGPRRAELSFCDEAPLGGVQPYWVRVVQVDQERAWSSPVYVHRP